MLRLLRPALITLTLAVPTASYALGLGDIHVESALHEPLIAQIELVGVLDEEVGRLTASLASDELFQKYNLERAQFLYGTTLKVGRDAQGRAVLNMRSTEKLTEPVVTLLVDLHSPGGELVREYTLFLDPAGLTANAPTVMSSTTPVVPATKLNSAQSPTPALEPTPSSAAPVAGSRLLGQTYTVARRDTLARIVTATGARSRIERHRMMIAIYRANPAAFQNNFNRMHTGVTLTLPTAVQLAAISVDETNREYDAQMAEWRTSLHRGAAPVPTPAAATKVSPAVPAPSAPVPTTISDRDPAILNQRIASLEQSLAAIQQELKKPLPLPTPTPAAAPAVVAHTAAPVVAEEATSEDDDDEAPPVRHRGLQLVAIGATAGLLFFAGAWFYLRRRNHAYHMTPRYPAKAVVDKAAEPVEFSTPPPPVPQRAASASEPVEAKQSAPQDEKSASSWFEDSFSTPIADLLNDPTVSLAVEDTAQLPFETLEPTTKLPQATQDTEVLVAPELEFAGDTVEQKFSFFNPEATQNTEHVVMGTGRNEPKPFVERRKNPADVLRQAIEKEPDRSDLRLKLLELYYTAAAENRRAFLEATRQLARNDNLASPEDWNRIADMGRIIAPDDELFSSDSNVDDKRVA